jgi:hypothetical protein
MPADVTLRLLPLDDGTRKGEPLQEGTFYFRLISSRMMLHNEPKGPFSDARVVVILVRMFHDACKNPANSQSKN